MKARYISVFLLLVIVGAAASVALGPRLLCEAKGGQWGRIGLSPVLRCNLPTSDAGKECSDSDECEGVCMVELSTDDGARAKRGEIIYANGKCSAWEITVGCHALVQDGIVVLICID